MGDSAPTVSVGVPVYNGERYLQAALQSIQSQTLTNFEVVIADNASTDNTSAIARRFCSEDNRFSYLRHERNLGASANFNSVFWRSSARFFTWHAYDDMIAPSFLEECVHALKNGDPTAVLAYPRTLLVDTEGHPLGVYGGDTRGTSGGAAARLDALIGPGDPERSLLHFCFPVFGVMKRSALEGTRLIANMPRSDNLLLVELALTGPFIEIDEPLFLRRQHDQGSVIAVERAARGPEIERRLAAWFDPERGKRFPATVTRLGIGYARAALRAPIAASERVRCLRIVAGWALRRWRVIGGELKILAREFLGQRGS